MIPAPTIRCLVYLRQTFVRRCQKGAQAPKFFNKINDLAVVSSSNHPQEVPISCELLGGVLFSLAFWVCPPRGRRANPLENQRKNAQKRPNSRLKGISPAVLGRFRPIPVQPAASTNPRAAGVGAFPARRAQPRCAATAAFLAALVPGDRPARITAAVHIRESGALAVLASALLPALRDVLAGRCRSAGSPTHGAA